MSFDFHQSQVANDNLGGLADPASPANLRFNGLAPGIDLVVTNLTIYHDTAGYNANGRVGQGKFGQINQRIGTTVDYLFQFVDANTQKNKTIDEFYWTFYDLDQQMNGNNAETLSVFGYDGYIIQENNDIAIATDANGDLTFQSTKLGWGCDNPSDPVNLGPITCCDVRPGQTDCTEQTIDQRARSVMFVFKNTDSFRARFSVAGNFPNLPGGRNVLFAGVSNLVDLCPS